MHLQRLGPFRLERLLGRGGMGAVYVGIDDQSGQQAAIKLLSAHLADDETFRERFKQEIETLKRLLHPHIVQLFGYGEEEGYLYYVMELVEGRSLQDELSAGRRFHWREVARIGIAIAQALKHAHDRGIIHRDLKPANLLIDGQEHIKLTDFGIAKLYGGANVTAEGGVLGTADYMSPEQSLGEQVTTRCDLYALGSVLYALLTGKPPFLGKSLAEVVSALQKEKPIPLRRLAPDTPEEFERIVAQLLEKDPNQRIPTAVAVANRLKAMERALSLETRIGTSLDDDPPSPAPPTTPHSAVTQAADYSGQRTAPLPGNDEAEYRLAGEDPTQVTKAQGAASPSDRTALSTQAGKKTGVGSDAGTFSDRSKAASDAPPPKVTRFVTVSEDELRGRREVDDSPLRQWSIAAALALVGTLVIGGAVFLATRRPSADRLYSSIQTVANRDSDGELAAVESEMKAFLEAYPQDPRHDQVVALQERLAAYRLERTASLRILRKAPSSRASPLELAYQEASQLSPLDPGAALAHFQAILAVFSAQTNQPLSEQEQQWLKLSQQQVARLAQEVQQQTAEQRSAVRLRLDHAQQVAASDLPAARAIWQGIVTLYHNKTWAQELVVEARAALAEHPVAARQDTAGRQDTADQDTAGQNVSRQQ